jgi:hypothetical protein
MHQTKEYLEFVNCDFCGCEDNTTVSGQSDFLRKVTSEVFNVVKCNECGLLFTNPRSSVRNNSNLFPTDCRFWGQCSLRLSIKSKLGFFIKQFASNKFAYLVLCIPLVSRFVALQVKPHVVNSALEILRGDRTRTFLDIGCGSGRHAHF